MSLVDLKKAMKEKAVTIGTKETLRKLKEGTVSTIYVANNCKPAMREELLHLRKIKEFTLIELDVNAVEVGNVCKKQYPVSIVSY